MKRIPMLTGIVLFSTALAFGQAPDKALLDKYCAGCHNDKVKAGGFTLSSVDLTQPAKHAAQLEKVALKLRSGMMPPVGMPRPDVPTLKTFVTSLESSIDKAAAANPNPGRPILHRLNRTEYANSIRELLEY